MHQNLFAPKVYIVFIDNGEFDVVWNCNIAYASIAQLEFLIKSETVEYIKNHPSATRHGFYIRKSNKGLDRLYTRLELSKIFCGTNYRKGVFGEAHYQEKIDKYIHRIKGYEEYRELLKKLPSY